jgi:predicted metalloendopeptidase
MSYSADERGESCRHMQNIEQFRKLYPNLSAEELIEAQDNFYAYLDVVWSIYQRIAADPKEYSTFKKLVENRE